MAATDDLKSAASALRKAATALRAQNAQLSRDADRHKSLIDRQVSEITTTIRLREEEETRANNSDQVNMLKDQEQMLRMQAQAKAGERNMEDQRIKDLMSQNEALATKYEAQAKDIEGDIANVA